MARYWPILLVVLLAGLAIYVFAFSGADVDPGLSELDREDEDVFEPAELQGLSDVEREAFLARQREAERRRAEQEAAAEVPEPAAPAYLLEGQVVDAESGDPIRDARVWLEGHGEPCPRLPFWNGDPFAAESTPATRSAKDGTFRIEGGKPEAAPDLFANADGYILHVTCAVELPSALVIRLEKGLTIEGVIRDRERRPVKDVRLSARAAPETPQGPGHATSPLDRPKTDGQGRFELGGFRPGAVLVDVDHPHYMPLTVGPVEPGGKDLEIELVAAYRATFHIRTDDGRRPEHPTLVWQTTGVKPRSAVVLLTQDVQVANQGVVSGLVEEFTSQVVRLPCDAQGVVLQIRADGYASWQSDPLRLPIEGGSETFEVKLTGDLATGSIRLSLEDDARETVSVLEADVSPSITRLDQGAGGAAYVVEQSADLKITDLPEGRYRITLLSAKFAPVITEVIVTPGQETHQDLRVRPPAKVRVKVHGSGEKLVKWEIHGSEGRVAFIAEDATGQRVDEATGEPVAVSGPGGLLISGLAAGTYSIVIVDEAHYAVPVVVHLTEGDTEEVDIEVRPR